MDGRLQTRRAARSIATIAPLSSSSAVSQGIGRVNPAGQDASLEYETSTALQDSNQALGTEVFNGATAPAPSIDTLRTQAYSLTQLHTQQAQISSAQFLSRARQGHVITPQQYRAIARSPVAQAEFAEGYKTQLDSMIEHDTNGDGPSNSKRTCLDRIGLRASPKIT